MRMMMTMAITMTTNVAELRVFYQKNPSERRWKHFTVQDKTRYQQDIYENEIEEELHPYPALLIYSFSFAYRGKITII